MVHRRDPTSCALVFGVGVFVRGLALDFENDVNAISKSNDEIGFVNLWVAVKFVRNIEFQAIISSVTIDDVLFR